MSEPKETFVHSCGEKIVVLNWTQGFWRIPSQNEEICGVVPLKNERCTCGEPIRPEPEESEEPFTGTLFDEAEV